jgi:acyl carrier protein
MLRFMRAEDLAFAFGPKALAAATMYQVVAFTPLEAVLAFSSIAAMHGNMGQANYAAANAWLDAASQGRRTSGIVGSSLQIPAVSGAGMGASTFTKEELETMGAIGLDVFAACLSHLLVPGRAAAAHRTQVPLTPSILGSLTALSALAEIGRDTSTSGATLASERREEAGLALSLAPLPAAERRQAVESAVLRVVRELAGASAGEVGPATPLMEAGVDSLAATELSSRLKSLTGVTLSPTLVFDEPTPRAIAAHLLQQLGGDDAVEALVHHASVGRGLLAFLDSMVGRWPGGCGDDSCRWGLQGASGDALGSVPSLRWTLGPEVHSLSTTQLRCVRHGGFISGADQFDGLAFGISPAEAGAMDPQQRLLTELGYAALHGTSHRRLTLMGGDSGVFLGMERPDWALAQPPAARGSVYTVTGDNLSVAAGRLSFVLGLQGPCSSIDTACASSLSALHGGLHAVRGVECGVALALGVSGHAIC